MEKMKFHWADGKGNTGSFDVTAPSVDECIKIAEEQTKDADITDYYSIA
ncbi:hypothetical protein [Gracilibacillus halophilus]|nr:hypothetical protein [Gracilibacillus halophilus]